MGDILVAGVGYTRGSSNGISYGIGDGNTLGSYDLTERRYSGGRSGGEVAGNIEGYPLGGSSYGM